MNALADPGSDADPGAAETTPDSHGAPAAAPRSCAIALDLPQFHGRCQPYIPAALGSRDLHAPGVREAQGSLARARDSTPGSGARGIPADWRIVVPGCRNDWAEGDHPGHDLRGGYRSVDAARSTPCGSLPVAP